MVEIRAVRELETWTGTNLFFGLVLAAVLLYVIYRAIRRFLDE